MLDKEFDKILKAKLEKLSLNSEKASWSNFEKLHSAQLGNNNEDAFDNAIKEKLVDHKKIGVDAGWAVFASKFGEQIASDNTFDSEIKENVDGYRADYNPSHWAILKSRLERALYLRERLYSSKAMEALIAVLLFISIANFSQFLINDKGEETIMPDHVVEAPFVNNIQEKIIKQSTVVFNDTKKDSKTIELDSKTTEVKPENLTQSQEASGFNLNRINTNDFSVDEGTKLSLQPTPSSPIEDAIVKDPEGIILEPKASEDIVKIPGLSSLAMRTDPLSKERKFTLSQVSVLSNELKEKAKGSFWFHTIVSSDINFIESRFGTPIGEEHYKTQTNGYSAFLALSYEINRWVISSGIGLGNYSFSTKINEESYLREMGDNSLGEYVVALEGIEHNTLNIPLNIEYGFLTTPSSWKLSATIGGDLKILNYTHYDIRNELINEFNVPGGIPTPWTNPEQFAKMKFIKGWAEGGNFTDVASLNLNAGLSIQKTFGGALALYFQPRYHFPVVNTSIKPTEDRISKLAFNFGMKFRLN